MKVNSINTYPAQSNNNTPAFNGRIITKGVDWTPRLKKAFQNSKAVKDLASGEKDVIGRLKTSFANYDDVNHYPDEELFRLSIEMKDPKASFMEKVKSFLGLNKRYVNTHSHSEGGMVRILKGIKSNVLEKLVNKKH